MNGIQFTQCPVDRAAHLIRANGATVSNSEKTHYHGRYLGIKERDRWEYAFRTNASGVVVLVPITAAGELVLVEQFRIPVDSQVIELPAGLVGDTSDRNESLETAARRELLEETGFQAASLEVLLNCPSSPGMSNEMVTIFYASGLAQVGAGGGDASEDITVHLVPLKHAVEWLDQRLASGIMLDPKIYAGLFWAQQRA